MLAAQTLTYTSNVLEIGGQGAALIEACWPALRQLASELQDPALNGPVMQAVTAFENMQQVTHLSRWRSAHLLRKAILSGQTKQSLTTAGLVHHVFSLTNHADVSGCCSCRMPQINGVCMPGLVVHLLYPAPTSLLEISTPEDPAAASLLSDSRMAVGRIAEVRSCTHFTACV